MESRNRQLKITVDARLSSAFKSVCKESGVSMASELSSFMESRVGKTDKKPLLAKPLRTATRGERRSTVYAIAMMLAEARDAEEAYMDRIPENLRGGHAYEAAEFAVCNMEDAITLLEEAYG